MIVQADARRIPLADRSVHCVVTSPPYYALRDYGVAGQLGLEKTPEQYVAAMVQVFGEVRRVLRDDGTLWLNIGDSYQAAKGQAGGVDPKQPARRHGLRPTDVKIPGLKAKDLIGIPWMLAFALRADGWYLRSDIIWHKPNPMPESVTDRPSKSHEYMFLLTKRASYFYDGDAIRTEHAPKSLTHRGGGQCGKEGRQDSVGLVASGGWSGIPRINNPEGANSRTVWAIDEDEFAQFLRWKADQEIAPSVWTIPSQPFKGSHFATMPVALAERCIKAGTSERGVCPECGGPWERVTESEKGDTEAHVRPKETAGMASKTSTLSLSGNGSKEWAERGSKTRSLGWQPTCSCPPSPPVPAKVFDPFGGALTTILAARRLGRIGIATDLSRDYLEIGRARLRGGLENTAGHAAKPDALPLFAEEAAP